MELLTIESMKVNYGNFVALNIAEKITIEEGDRIGIIGNNGAGKTTFAKALCGMVNYSGNVSGRLKPSDIAIHLQDNNYIARMPVTLIIEMILNTSIKKNQKLFEIIQVFDFEPCLKKRFAQLSGGQKQKMTIIIILMQDKPLTFFDEVTSGLDFVTRVKLIEKVQEWYRRKAGAVCTISHYYDELEKFVTKLLIIHEGKIVDYGNADKLFEKYCSSVIYVIENNERSLKLIKNFKSIAAPLHLIALPASDKSVEKKLANLFAAEGINHKRTNKDFEILFVNAIKKAQEVSE